MRVTLKDLAAKLGVTKTTISLALRNSPQISAARREEIQRLAKQMDYVPDPFLSALSKYRRNKSAARTQGVIAWLNHWAAPERLRGYHEFENYWRGARLAAQRLGYQLEEFVWPSDTPAKRVEEMLRVRGVLGLLIPPHPPEVEWGDFDWGIFSLMRFGFSVRRVDANLVTTDQQQAMVTAVKAIYARGYGRIGLVYNQAHDRSLGGNYFGGFLWAHKLLRISDVIPPLNSEMKTSQLAARTKRELAAWMKTFQPEAVFTMSPETPVLLRELGYRIPRDVAVASMSPCDIAVDAGIDQRSTVIGRVAAEMLIKQIGLNERGEPSDPCRILVESHWQDGKSLPPRHCPVPILPRNPPVFRRLPSC
jgi:DNA-binding LacI/PurR family transcriptional regulator